MNKSKFAERLKELRTEKGLTCMELGKAIGVSDMSIVRWENKQADVKGEYLITLANFFKVTAGYLLGLEH